MIIKHPALRRCWSGLDQLKVDDLVNNPQYLRVTILPRAGSRTNAQNLDNFRNGFFATWYRRSPAAWYRSRFSRGLVRDR
jgi:hypothetical protein